MTRKTIPIAHLLSLRTAFAARAETISVKGQLVYGGVTSVAVVMRIWINA